MDMRINNLDNYMMLGYLEFEQKDTIGLPSEGLGLQNTVELFEVENFLLTSESNARKLDHLKLVVSVTVGRLLAENIHELAGLKKFLPNHCTHSTSVDTKKPAVLFVNKPEYLSEQKNDEMVELCERLQDQFLHLVSLSVENKEQYLKDLVLMKNKVSECLF